MSDNDDDSFSDDENNQSSAGSTYDTDDEVNPEPIPAIFSPIPGQNVPADQPLQFDVKLSKEAQSSPLPLCLMMNCRSACNKISNLRELLNTVGPSVTILSETWEREKQRLDVILKSRQFKIISYYRKNKSPGGGCAIIYDKNRFRADDPDIIVPDNIEAAWSVLTPLSGQRDRLKVKRILVGSIYVSPRSQVKSEIIEHIIQTIHSVRAKYDNEINCLIGGDFNRLDYSEILDCYGGLKQIISVPTRKQATLEILLTDLHALYHPPTTLPPLQVDPDKAGKDSDHDVVLFAPLNNLQYKVDRVRKTIKTRPIPQSQVLKFEKDLANHPWEEILSNQTPDKQTEIFHEFLMEKLDFYFPEKSVKISSLDKKWFTPNLKQLHRRMQRAFHRNRSSQKYKKLKLKYKKLKRDAIKSFYSNFVSELKLTDPGKWYSMAKKIGATDQMNEGDVKVECLSGLTNIQAARKIAEHFAAVSNEYSPIDVCKLPCYLPAQPPPQVEEYEVYLRLQKLKKTKSTLPIDIPEKIRKECSPFLAGPLTSIINNSLTQAQYPAVWKQEWITPAPKVTHPKQISDLRKISSTSDYSKIFEGFLKGWVMEDILKNIDIGQFGGLSGVGTEHMIVWLLDRILLLLDRHPDRSAVILTSLDWSAAFDRQDPTLAIQKFVQLGVRPSLIPLLASYLTDRKMKVKFNGEMSEFLDLVGGGPQGTLLGQIEYLVQSNDSADCVPEEDRFKYIDDLSLLQLVCLSGLVTEYDFTQHVASDIGTDQVYLPPDAYATQNNLESISNWTNENLMRMNETKCNYMIFSRSETDFATRLTLNNTKLDQISVTKLLGVWISDDMSWSRNCKEICIKAYSRLQMLTKLKYVGVGMDDLLDVYKLFIRSCIEYCSVAFHSSLTIELSDKLERIQKTCLRVILGEMYIGYSAALEMSGLDTLFSRREKRCIDFSLKCLKNKRLAKAFPLKPAHGQDTRESEMFTVNFARTSTYRDSAIPYCQRLLNEHYKSKNENT